MSQPENCVVCATEALLRTKTYIVEALKQNQIDKLREAVREVLHAEDHLVQKFPEAAQEVRGFRKEWEPCLWKKESPATCVPPMTLDKVDELILKVLILGEKTDA